MQEVCGLWRGRGRWCCGGELSGRRGGHGGDGWCVVDGEAWAHGGGGENWWETNVAVVVARTGWSLLMSATMTSASTSKVHARRRAREATRRANEARAARDKASIEDAANYLVAVGRIAEVETWKKERFAQLREQVEAEAGKRVAVHRAEAGAAIVRMQERGETLATIAVRTEAGIGEVRAMLRHAPKSEKATATNGSRSQ